MNTEDEDLKSTIARLRASKQKHDSKSKVAGTACGANWAKQHAEYDELDSLKCWSTDPASLELETMRDVYKALRDDNDSGGYDQWLKDLAITAEQATDRDFAWSFVWGALDVFSCVEDQL
ncbi:MAG TPA: hypothetical protein VIT91_20950 [Chthoniobacterales bacterium]